MHAGVAAGVQGVQNKALLSKGDMFHVFCKSQNFSLSYVSRFRFLHLLLNFVVYIGSTHLLFSVLFNSIEWNFNGN